MLRSNLSALWVSIKGRNGSGKATLVLFLVGTLWRTKAINLKRIIYLSRIKA